MSTIRGDEYVDLDKNKHDRSSFNCGKEELDTFIKEKAAKHMEAGISKTMLLPSRDTDANGKHQICAFFTVTPTTIERNSLPNSLAKKLPHYPVPVFLIAQLAVHQDHNSQGLGKITLVKSLEYLWHVSKQMPAYAVIVDCLDKDARAFYDKYDFVYLCEHNDRERLFMPMKTVCCLFE